MKMICSKNRGYKWFQNNHGYFKGYIQLSDKTVLRDNEAINYFYKCKSFEEFLDKLRICYGCFAIVINGSDKTWAATDIARSIPLYYSSDFTYISDSSESIRVALKIERENYSPIRVLELYEKSYVFGTNTCYDSIKQLDLGMAIEYKDNCQRSEYYYLHTNKIIDRPKDEIIEELQRRTHNMINRLLPLIENKTICISLSGGYDSRYLACSLKDNGIDDVICYTYGRRDSFEVQQSKKVASALGYKWICIENSDEKVKAIINDTSYFEYCNEHDFTIYIQNYIAVKELVEKKLVADNTVFLTGLCNDMPTGSYIPSEEQLNTYDKSLMGVADYLIDSNFFQFPITDEAKKVYEADIIKILEKKQIQVFDYASFVTACVSLETGGVHSRWYLCMNKPHEFFENEWLLPCWDKELLDFWYSVPIRYRMKQSLYEEYVTINLAGKYGVGNKKTVSKTGTSFKGRVKRKIGGLIVPIAYRLHIPLKRNTDFNNFAPLEVILYNRIAQKNGVKNERAAIRLLLMMYVSEYRYGELFYKRIKQYLK